MISIVIPAFNEEKRISPTIEAYCSEFKEPFECIVVLNGCTDNTLGVVQSFDKKFPGKLKIINISEAIGKGGAITRGFSEATGEIIGFVDADLATPVKDTIQLIAILRQKNVDGVIASRLYPGSQVHGRGILRTIVSKTFAAFTRFLFDISYKDTQCGAKFFTRSAITRMLPEITAKDMTIDVDLLMAAHKHHLKIIEVPTEWFDRSSSAMLGSASGFIKSSVKMFASLIRLQRKYEKV